MRIIALILVLFTLHASRSTVTWAQSSNGTISVVQEGVSSGGGRAGSGNPMSLVSVIGQPAGGRAENGVYAVNAGFLGAVASPPGGIRVIPVDGTIDEPVSSVMVNGMPATVTDSTFHAEGIAILEGPNAITATATDLANNVTNHTITVYLDTIPPARPTVETTLAILPEATPYTLCGTKTASTSIWINGSERVALNEETTWCVTFTGLIEGDNLFTILARDAAGNASTAVTANILVDALPPEISNLQYLDVNALPLNLDPTTEKPKTNFSPVTLTGEVDDSLTTVVINGLTASRNGLTFEVAVPLVLGANALALEATSYFGHPTTQTLPVLLGTIPTLTSVVPPDGAKAYADSTNTIQLTATDAEADALEYQLWLDGVLFVDWTPVASHPWTPTLAALGLHTLEARVRDPFGGEAPQSVEVYVVRQPVLPP